VRLFAFAGLADRDFGGGDLAFRAGVFADLRGAGALRGAALAAGFLVRAAFFAGIKFSGAY
jgi:hypothetical protein